MRICSVKAFPVHISRDMASATGLAGSPARLAEASGGSRYRLARNCRTVCSQRVETTLVRVDPDEGVTGWAEAQSPVAPENHRHGGEHAAGAFVDPGGCAGAQGVVGPHVRGHARSRTHRRISPGRHLRYRYRGVGYLRQGLRTAGRAIARRSGSHIASGIYFRACGCNHWRKSCVRAPVYGAGRERLQAVSGRNRFRLSAGICKGFWFCWDTEERTVWPVGGL
jgi:hypothetical protein